MPNYPTMPSKRDFHVKTTSFDVKNTSFDVKTAHSDTLASNHYAKRAVLTLENSQKHCFNTRLMTRFMTPSMSLISVLSVHFLTTFKTVGSCKTSHFEQDSEY